jgi:hypothetical protein
MKTFKGTLIHSFGPLLYASTDFQVKEKKKKKFKRREESQPLPSQEGERKNSEEQSFLSLHTRQKIMQYTEVQMS